MAMNGWKACIAALLLLMAVFAAPAESRRAAIAQAESSMLVKGSVEIDTTGKLERMTIDGRDKLPGPVVDMLDKASQTWTFKPTLRDGKAMRAKGPMTVRFVAKKVDADHVSLQISDATFGSDEARLDEVVASVRMTPPRYPEDAARAGAGGAVYLLVRVGRDGKVEEAVAEQTNLSVAGTENEMKTLRKLFENASIAAARKWTYRPPTAGSEATADHWVARVPVTFTMLGPGSGDAKSEFGVWKTYIPGPRAFVPWAEREQALAGGDALGDGGLYQLGSGPQLLTPLGPPG